LAYLARAVKEVLEPDDYPVRLAITATDEQFYHLELGVLHADREQNNLSKDSLFNFSKRKLDNCDSFNSVLLIPTGVGAEIGGHSGDGGPLAKLMSSVCDTLITHPNVVNAADINELPSNGLYVEGSVISNLLMGSVGLQKVRSNRVALVIDNHIDRCISEHSINAVSAARAALGLDCPLVIKMEDKINMNASYASSGRANGRVDSLENIVKVLEEHRSKYDAVAISSIIGVPKQYHHDYYLGDMVNPWGGVEAMLTHFISSIFQVPSAHAPMMESQEILNLNVGVVDPRMAAEVISVTYLHCVLKGLHSSPRIISDQSQFNHHSVITARDIACLIIPDGCIGLPTLAAMEQGVTVIAVRENKNLMKNDLTCLPFAPGKLFIVDSYLEAIGVMSALREGIAVETVRRPLSFTRVLPELKEEVVEQYKNVVKLRAK